jgi:hypothetical protein
MMNDSGTHVEASPVNRISAHKKTAPLMQRSFFK